MGKVLIYVEGQTEEVFVKQVLAPHLWNVGVYVVPTLAATKRVPNGADLKGGVPPYQKVKRDIQHLLRDASAVAVTTLLDFYGLPADFPGRRSVPPGSCHDRVAYVEEELARDVGDRRFRPHLQLHEFEAMMFVSPGAVASLLGNGEREAELARATSQFASPEDINDSPTTAPSKRLRVIYPTYRKPFHGPLITARIGLERIRSECRHFDQWVTFLEGVASA